MQNIPPRQRSHSLWIATLAAALAAVFPLLDACTQPTKPTTPVASSQPARKPRTRRTAADAAPQFPFEDTTLSIDERVADLVSRLTLDEKVSQMMMDSPAIDRLNIPAYHWWSEALHGVARNGEATVFPQAIGMASTFNPDLHLQMAQIIALEARAKHHEAVRLGKRGIYLGLDLWSPNINIFRDPRWGRGQETYGEDPYLTGRFGVAFCQGLQGNDPNYYQTIATPKHFAVHSGPEPERHRFDAVVSEQDLWTTYLPAFEASIREGKADSIMGAYNSVDGLPCVANPRLLTDILRKQWGFDGYVVSDVGADRNIWQDHMVTDNPERAAAMAVKAGCDLGGDTTFKSLPSAVHLGMITEAEIDTSVTRLFTARFKLGMFDPPDLVTYAQTPYDQNDTREHDAVAYEAAKQSMVLLKNADNTLPLKNNFSTIAVIGPNADALMALEGNYNGIPSHPVTVLQGIRNAVPATTHVLYAPGSPYVTEQLPLEEVVPQTCLLTEEAARPLPGLKANYFPNLNLSGRSNRSRVDNTVDFDWTLSAAKEPLDLTTGFSARWTGFLVAPESGTYTLGFTVRDGVRLFLNDQLVLDDWQSNSTKRNTACTVDLDKGHHYKITIEYFRPNETRTPDPAAAGSATQPARRTGGRGRARTTEMADQDGNVNPPGGTESPATTQSAATQPTTPTAQTPATQPATTQPSTGGGGGGGGGGTPKDDALLQFRWTRPSTDPSYAEAVRIAQKADAVVLVLGLTADLEREESFVHFKGFDGGDRTSLDLPDIQETLLEKVTQAAGNKPVILVLENGSALSVNWANDHVPAILEAWYPGQRGGDAVADVLFGKSNPAGRLPVTFYKSAADLPPFDDYNMQGRTYRYFTGPVLYPFGYGLSYSSFKYSDLMVPTPGHTTADTLTVSVQVQNASATPGDEVVQLYLSHAKTAEKLPASVPDKQLVGFKRVSLQPNEQKTITFTLTPLQLAIITADGHRQTLPGALTLSAGGSSGDLPLTTTITLTGDPLTPDFKFIPPTVK